MRQYFQEAGTQQHLGLDAALPVPVPLTGMWRGFCTQQACRINPRCQMWISVSHSKALNFHFSFIKRKTERKKLHSHHPKCCHTCSYGHIHCCVYSYIRGCNSTGSTEPYQISMDYGVYFYRSCCKRIIAYLFFFLGFSMLQKYFFFLCPF